MPIFDYKCPACDECIEIFLKRLEPEGVSCQKCGTEMERLLSRIGGYSISGNNSASVRPKQAGSFKRESK